MLNLENMADDPVLNEHSIAPPGTKNAPTNMAGALWKLAAEMFPDVGQLSNTITINSLESEEEER